MVNQDYDAMFEGEETLKFHITYNDELKLSELSSCVKLLSKGCNKFIKNNSIAFKDEIQTEAVVKGVENGSFVIDVLLPFMGQVSIGLFINFIYDSFKSHFKNKINFDNNSYILKEEYRNNYKNDVFSINVEKIDNAFIVNIHINNRDYNWR